MKIFFNGFTRKAIEKMNNKASAKDVLSPDKKIHKKYVLKNSINFFLFSSKLKFL